LFLLVKGLVMGWDGCGTGAGWEWAGAAHFL